MMLGSRRERYLYFAALTCATALLLAAAHAEEPQESVDLFSIRRVMVPAERVAAEMERAKLGALRQVPWEDFEDLVRRAERSASALKKEPRLIEAKYRARLEDASLVGTAEWELHNPGPGTRLFPLDSFNLALQRLPRSDQRDALVAEFDGKRPALLLDKLGIQKVSLEWSARGDVGLEGIRFDLQLPAATLVTLDLSLPRSYVVAAAPDSYTSSGPIAGTTGDEQIWRVSFKNAAPLRLRIQRAHGADTVQPVMTAKLDTRQQLSPDGLEASYSFELHALRYGTRALEFEGDSGLWPLEVAAPDLESWEFQEAPNPDSPSLLRVRLREPLHDGTVRIQCLAPLRTPARPVAWTSPALRLRQAVPRGELLVLRVHPEVRFDDWRPGWFRLQGYTTEADGTRVLTLSGGSLELPGVYPARPQALVEATGVEYQARQLAWWQVQPRKSTLTCQFTVETLRGRLFQVPLNLPAGWRVEHVEVSPLRLLRDWEVRQERGASVLFVEFERPLTPRASGAESRTGPVPAAARILVRLTADGPALEWAFPDVVPRGARHREGALAIDFDEQVYRATVETTALPTEPGEEGPWGNQRPEYYYPYADDPVRGTLRLEARDPRVGVHCASEVLLASGRAALVAHVVLQPEVGSPDSIELVASAAPAGKWEWKTVQGSNSVRSFEPVGTVEAAALAALAAGLRLDTVAALGAVGDRPGAPQRWRLTLARPLREPLFLDGVCEIARSGESRWHVPLLSASSPSYSENEVTLFLTGSSLLQVETEGVREVSAAPPTPRGQPGSAWRTFRYSALPASLRLIGGSLSPGLTGTTIVADRAALTSYLEPGGRLLHHYRFRLRNWRQRSLPLRLPRGASVVAARVDGLWISQVPPAASVEDKVLIVLPAFATVNESHSAEHPADDWHVYDVIFAVEGPARWLWAALPTPDSILPVDPIEWRHTWRLPPGLVPLHTQHYRKLPTPTPAHSIAVDSLPFGLASRWATSAVWTGGNEWQNEQRQHLSEAAASVIKAAEDGVMSFGEFLDRLADQQVHSASSGRVVVDVNALCQAGVTQATMLPIGRDRQAPPWESLGLVYVACREAPLLTTRRERDQWRGAGVGTDGGGPPQGYDSAGVSLSPSIESAIAEAAARGHDSSGRFRLAAEWLRCQDRQGATTAANYPNTEKFRSLPVGLELPDSPDWTEWECIAGSGEDGDLIVVRQNVLPGLALALTALLSLVLWRLPEAMAYGRLAALLCWLGAAGLGYLWLPEAIRILAWWPMMGGATIALAWYLISAIRKQRYPEQSRPVQGSSVPVTPIVSSGLLLAALVGLCLSKWETVRAETPREPTVFIIREIDGDKFSVLAPPELVDRLETQVRRTGAPTGKAVLVSADYEGRLVGDTVDFKAEVMVYCPDEAAAQVNLSLDGVQLVGETMLDGARAYPIAGRTSEPGYTLRIPTLWRGFQIVPRRAGLHRLNLSFRCPVVRTGAESEVRLTLPRIPRSRLTMEVPSGSSGLRMYDGQAPICGRQRIVSEAAGPRLEADLGWMYAPLRVHWVQQSGAPQPAKVQAQETYLWDLRTDTATLTALLHFRVTQGSLPEVEISLPEPLDVLSADLLAVADRQDVRIKEWHVSGTGNGRTLRVDLQYPMTGELGLALILAPRRPNALGKGLPLPRPLGTEPVESFLACQFTGLNARIQSQQGLLAYDRGQFARRWQSMQKGNWFGAGRDLGTMPPRDPIPFLGKVLPWLPTQAFSFHRASTGAPALQFEVEIAAPRVQAVQQISWRVGLEQMDFQATVTLTAPDGDLALVEWDVPPALTVGRLNGADVVLWSQTGSRVQAWLTGPRRNTELQLTGWIKTRAAQGNGVPAPGPASLAKTALHDFRLPCLHLVRTSTLHTWIRLTGASGLALEAIDPDGLLSLPDPRSRATELLYFTDRPRHDPTFHFHLTPSLMDARVFTVAEIRGEQLGFVALADLQVIRGDAKKATIEVRNWPGSEVQCEILEGTAQVRRIANAKAVTFSLDLRPGTSGRYRFSLTGTVPVDRTGAGVPVPDVLIGGASRVERWLGIGNASEQQSTAPHGLERTPDPARSLGSWADPLRRNARAVWRATSEVSGMMLKPQTDQAGTSTIQVLLAEQECAVIDGHHWVYQSTYWVYHEALPTLTFLLPGRARLLSMFVDGRAVTPLQPAPSQLWLPLPGGVGSRRISLRWMLEDEPNLTRPNMQMPYLEGADMGPVLWTVNVPAGYEATPLTDSRRPPTRMAAPASAGGLDLRRAFAQHRLSKILAGRIHSGDTSALAALAAAQRRFYRTCHQAEQELAALGSDPDTGPNGQPLPDWLRELREQNRELARQQGFESLRGEAERQASSHGPYSRQAPEIEDRTAGVGLGPAPESVRADSLSDDPLPRRGAPLYWQGGAGAYGPRLVLSATHAGDLRRALGESVLLLISLIVIALATQLPSLRNWLRLFWPEQVAVLGCLLSQTFGVHWLLVLLIVSGIFGRLFYLGHWLLRTLRRPMPAAAQAPGSGV